MSIAGPRIADADLHAYVDGRLPAARAAEVKAWLANHPAQSERVEDYRRTREQLRATYAEVMDEPVPERLMRRARRSGWTPAGRAAAWIALGVAVGALAGWQLHDRRPSPGGDAGSAMARSAALAHSVYSPEVRHPVEVGADQEAHLVSWLSKRLGAPLRAPKLEDVGYSLVGGRLLPGESGPVAQFMYQCSAGTRVTLYVKADRPGNRETAIRYAKEGDVRVFYWVDRKLGYALATSDISRDDLLRVSNAVYHQLNP